MFTTTLETPVPAVAPQVKALLSSLPERLTLNDAAFWSTAVIGFAGALIIGGLLTTTQGVIVIAELRGAAVATVKSLALLSVSVQPFDLRNAAVVAASVPVGPLPSKKFVPVP